MVENCVKSIYSVIIKKYTNIKMNVYFLMVYSTVLKSNLFSQIKNPKTCLSHMGRGVIFNIYYIYITPVGL